MARHVIWTKNYIPSLYTEHYVQMLPVKLPSLLILSLCAEAQHEKILRLLDYIEMISGDDVTYYS